MITSKKGKLRLDILFYTIVGFCFAIPITFFIWMHLARTEKRNTDALIILGYRCDDDQIHPLLKERLDTAIFLFESYQFRYIILTGGAVASTLTEAEIMRDYLVKRGIPEKMVLLETTARNTVYNIVNCNRMLKESNLQSCLLISNSFHIRRMKYITERLHLSASFYAKRNFKTILKQFKVTFEEIQAFRLTLPWLEKVKRTN